MFANRREIQSPLDLCSKDHDAILLLCLCISQNIVRLIHLDLHCRVYRGISCTNQWLRQLLCAIPVMSPGGSLWQIPVTSNCNNIFFTVSRVFLSPFYLHHLSPLLFFPKPPLVFWYIRQWRASMLQLLVRFRTTNRNFLQSISGMTGSKPFSNLRKDKTSGIKSTPTHRKVLRVFWNSQDLLVLMNATLSSRNIRLKPILSLCTTQYNTTTWDPSPREYLDTEPFGQGRSSPQSSVLVRHLPF